MLDFHIVAFHSAKGRASTQSRALTFRLSTQKPAAKLRPFAERKGDNARD